MFVEDLLMRFVKPSLWQKCPVVDPMTAHHYRYPPTRIGR